MSSSTTAASAESTPAVLLGTWIYVPDPHIQLLVMPDKYEVLHPPEHVYGRLAVRGQEMDFLDSTFCNLGVGRYGWSVENGRLRLASTTPDPCSGRSMTFDGGIFRHGP